MSRRLALLISNNQYSDVNLAKLAAPLADAEALASVLRNSVIGAFDDVQTLVNQPSADVRHAIADFFHGKQPADLLLLYFSGHGLLDDRSRLYLATPDTDAKLPRARSLEAAYIAQEMEDSRSKRQVLLLDCCHSGAFRQGITKSSVGQPVQTGSIFDGDGRVVLAASDATQYAFEGEKLVGQEVRSVFTHYLVEGLTDLRADSNGDGQVTVDELYEYLYPRVTAHTPAQTPVKWNYKQRGVFVLAGHGNSNPTATASTPSFTLSTSKAPGYRTWVVDQMYRGDFATIGEAIVAAKAGDKILIRPGIHAYEESLIIICRNRIHDGEMNGLFLHEEGRALIEDNDIFANTLFGIEIIEGSTPTVHNNQVHNNRAGGILIQDNGHGVIDGNNIFANRPSGIYISKAGNPTVRNNCIHSGHQVGISIEGQGAVLIEENKILANDVAGIMVAKGGDPTARNNRIDKTTYRAIWIAEKSGGCFENNDLRGNKGVWKIDDDCLPNVTRVGNIEK